MGILEFIIGLLLVFFVANLFLAIIPIPKNIVGTIIAILVVIFAWRLVF